MDNFSLRTSSCSAYSSGFLNQLQSEWNEFILEISHSTPHQKPDCDAPESLKKSNAKAAFIESLNKFNSSLEGNIFIPVPLNTLKKLFSPSKHSVDDIFKNDFFNEIKENLNLTKLSCKKLQQLLSIDESNEISDFPSPSLPTHFRNSAPPNLFPIKKSKHNHKKIDILKNVNRITSEKDDCFSRNKIPIENNKIFNGKENVIPTEIENKCTDNVRLAENNNINYISKENFFEHAKIEIIDAAKKPANEEAIESENGLNNRQNNGTGSDSSSLFYTFKHPRKILKPTIVCTYFSQKDLSKLYQAVKKLGFFEIENHVSSRTTHLVCGGTNKTINLCKAIARGCWILDKEWISKSSEANRWLLEERFERKSLSPAVQENRLRRQKSGSTYRCDLFSDCGNLYISTECSQPSAEELKELILLGSGRLVESPERASYIIGYSPKHQYVKEIWILNCVLQGYLVDVSKYIRDKSKKL